MGLPPPASISALLLADSQWVALKVASFSLLLIVRFPETVEVKFQAREDWLRLSIPFRVTCVSIPPSFFPVSGRTDQPPNQHRGPPSTSEALKSLGKVIGDHPASPSSCRSNWLVHGSISLFLVQQSPSGGFVCPCISVSCHCFNLCSLF